MVRFNLDQKSLPFFTWCLNESLLTDPFIGQRISTTLQEYFATKYPTDTNPGFDWAAHKSVVC